LTDDDLTTFGGQSDQLAGILQRKYGYGREQAEKEINEFSLPLNGRKKEDGNG
jgi:uncharacterized protein YjbJ (UPF0337 family)